jgi:hypothetical protein
MLAWIVLLFLVVAEVIGLKWWAMAQARPVFFNDWAPFLYSVLLLVDIIIAWFISTLYQTDGSPTLQLMIVLGTILAVTVGLGTWFLRWVVRLDMTDIGKKDK